MWSVDLFIFTEENSSIWSKSEHKMTAKINTQIYNIPQKVVENVTETQTLFALILIYNLPRLIRDRTVYV